MSSELATSQETVVARVNGLAVEEEQRQERFAKRVLAQAQDVEVAQSQVVVELLELDPCAS